MKSASRATGKSTATTSRPASRRNGCGGHSHCSCKECSAARHDREHAAPAAPASVEEVLGSPGQPLDGHARAFLEPRFRHDFSRVRVHTGPKAARSAADMNARAWTAGNHIAFGDGLYPPSTPQGAGLLAHELAHVVQQSGVGAPERPRIGRPDDRFEHDAGSRARLLARDLPLPAPARVSAPVLQRSFVSGLLDVLLFIPRLFGLEYFPAEQLREYLAGLRQRRGPARTLFSDNKARACVKRENELGPYDVNTKIWLVQDMLDGWTSGLDEGAIIDLLRRSPGQRAQIVTAVGRNYLWSKFDGRNRRIIEALTLTAADAGDNLVTRLRSLSPDQLSDYSGNATDPAVRDSIRRATALSNITAPVPVQAAITAQGQAEITINRVEITVLPDSINPSLGQHALTHGNFRFENFAPLPVTPQNANDPVAPPGTPSITLTIWTEFPSEASKNAASGYGAGTTLREHERAHGQAYFDFVTNNAPPVFPAQNATTVTTFNAAVQQYATATQDYGKRAGDFSLRAGDCSVPGRLPTNEQLAGTGYDATICREVH